MKTLSSSTKNRTVIYSCQKGTKKGRLDEFRRDILEQSLAFLFGIMSVRPTGMRMREQGLQYETLSEKPRGMYVVSSAFIECEEHLNELMINAFPIFVFFLSLSLPSILHIIMTMVEKT